MIPILPMILPLALLVMLPAAILTAIVPPLIKPLLIMVVGVFSLLTLIAGPVFWMILPLPVLVMEANSTSIAEAMVEPLLMSILPRFITLKGSPDVAVE